jgi:hypothetical protein
VALRSSAMADVERHPTRSAHVSRTATMTLPYNCIPRADPSLKDTAHLGHAGGG